jgi:hypothetical protein
MGLWNNVVIIDLEPDPRSPNSVFLQLAARFTFVRIGNRRSGVVL